MSASVTLNDRAFEATYDELLDVLQVRHLDFRLGGVPVVTDEGHAISYDSHGEIVGIVLASARRTFVRDGLLTATSDHVELVAADVLTAVAVTCFARPG